MEDYDYEYGYESVVCSECGHRVCYACGCCCNQSCESACCPENDEN